MALLLDGRFERPYCPSYGGKKWHVPPEYAKLWHKLLLEPVHEESEVQMKAKLGRQIILKLSTQFKAENQGRFVAVTFTGRVLAVCETLEALNRELANRNLRENYYIERIGHSAIAQV